MVDVLNARAQEFASNTYAESLGAAAEYHYRNRNVFASAFFAALARAFGSDAEGYLANTRCIYLVRPNDPAFAESIRSSALISSDDPFFSQSLDSSDPWNPTREEIQSLQRQKALQSGLQNSRTDAMKGLVSLAQICNPELKLGSTVLMTISQDGGTISPASRKQYTTRQPGSFPSGSPQAPGNQTREKADQSVIVPIPSVN